MSETPPPPPSNKPPCDRDDAIAVIKRLREAGHVAYFAGGCVRDELLGIEPKDYDVATDAPPQRVRELFSNTQAVGAAFGVILVRHRKSVVEVATFRSDGTYLDGRHPSKVHFTNAEHDAKRRDFTINGLFLDPLTDEVIDYVGGQQDLKSGIVRAIGEPRERFNEDFLRTIRAVRFAARFDFQIEPRTLAAIIENAPKFAGISPERVADELREMLIPDTRVAALKLLIKTGLLRVIMRFMPEQMPADKSIPDGLLAMMSPPDHTGPISFSAALAAIALHYRVFATGELRMWEFTSLPDAQQVARVLRQSLKLSNEETDRLVAILFVRPLLEDPGVATLKRFRAKPTFPESKLLLEAIARCDIMAMRIKDLMKRFASIEHENPAPIPLISGDDLTAAGLQPGKLFKRILDEVYDAQLEDRVKSKPEAIDLAMKIAKES